MFHKAFQQVHRTLGTPLTALLAVFGAVAVVEGAARIGRAVSQPSTQGFLTGDGNPDARLGQTLLPTIGRRGARRVGLSSRWFPRHRIGAIEMESEDEDEFTEVSGPRRRRPVPPRRRAGPPPRRRPHPHGQPPGWRRRMMHRRKHGPRPGARPGPRVRGVEVGDLPPQLASSRYGTLDARLSERRATWPW